MALHSVHKFEGHAGKVNGVAFSKNTTLLASASHDATVRMWNLSIMKVQRGFKKDSRPVHALAFSPDGNTLATGHDDGGVVLWSVSSGKKLKMVCKHANLVSAVAWTPNGDMIVSGGWDGQLIFSSFQTSSKQVMGHSGYVLSLSFSPDGKKLLSGGADNVAVIRSVAALEDTEILGHPNWVWGVCFSYHERYALTGCGDAIVRLFDTATGLELKRFEGHGKGVKSVAFSVDGSLVVSGSLDHSVRLWDTASGKELDKFVGHADTVNSVVFSSNSEYIASGSSDGAVFLFKMQSFRIACLEGQEDQVRKFLDAGELVDQTCLHLATSQGHIPIIKLLIEHGSNIDAADKDQNTSLHIACLNNLVSVADYLISQGANINAHGQGGYTALHMASEKGYLDNAQLLISRGADLTCTAAEETALDVACLNDQLKIATLLVQHRMENNEKHGYTALHYAVETGHRKLVELFMSCGANLAVLKLACMAGHEPIVKFLIENGCNLDNPNDTSEIVCYVCQDPFNTDRPRQILPCLHSVCSSCVNDILTSPGKPACLSCYESFSASDVVAYSCSLHARQESIPYKPLTDVGVAQKKLLDLRMRLQFKISLLENHIRHAFDSMIKLYPSSMTTLEQRRDSLISSMKLEIHADMKTLEIQLDTLDDIESRMIHQRYKSDHILTELVVKDTIYFCLVRPQVADMLDVSQLGSIKRRDYEKRSRSLKIRHSHWIGVIPLTDSQFLLADKEFLVKVSLDDISFSLSDGSTFNEAIIGVGVSSSHQLWVATRERMIRYSGLNTTTKKLCTIAISNLTSMAVSERTIVVACNSGISAFDHDGIHLWTHQDESLFPRKVAFSADEQQVIVCTKNWLTILSATHGYVLRQICHGLQGIRCVAAVPFSDLIIIAEQQRVSIWTLQGNFVDTLNISAVNVMAVLANGDIVVAEQHNKKELKILL